MDLSFEQMQSDYIDKYKGNPEDLEGIKTPEVLSSLLETQKEICDLGIIKEKNETNLYKMDKNEKSMLQKLSDLRQKDISSMTEDEKRELQNQTHRQVVKLSESLQVEEGEVLLDSQLKLALYLDQFNLKGSILQGLIQSYPERSLDRDTIKKRIENLHFKMTIENDRETKRLSDLKNKSETLKTLTSSVPEKFINDKEGYLVMNPVYMKWRQQTLNLKKKIETGIKTAYSLDKEGIEEVDKRKSEFKLYDKVCDLLEKFGKKGDNIKYETGKNKYFDYKD